VAFVGVDGGEIEEPSLESLEVVEPDLYRMIKYWFCKVVDRFGDKTEVQSRIPPARGLLYDRDDCFDGQRRKLVAVVGHGGIVSVRVGN